ncbi:MAG: hypothetical protein ACRC3B_17670 [Bacteroidia bacterium]
MNQKQSWAGENILEAMLKKLALPMLSAGLLVSILFKSAAGFIYLQHSFLYCGIGE